MFYILLVVDGDVPPTYQFCDEWAGKGLLLGHEAVAKAFGVPVENVHYLPREMMGNVEDMACIRGSIDEKNCKKKHTAAYLTMFLCTL